MKQYATKKLSKRDLHLVLEHIDYGRGLARAFARKRENLGIDYEDYEGAAMLGLCDAARRFDMAKGMQFRTFAYFRIRGAMYDLVRRAGGMSRANYRHLIKTPEKCREENAREEPLQGKKVRETSHNKQTLPYSFARTAVELAQLAEVVHEVGIRLHGAEDKDIVDISYSRQLSPEKEAAIRSSKRFVGRLIEKLPEDQRKILELRYFRGLSLREASPYFGRGSRSWLSRLHSRAIDSLRDLIVREYRRETGRQLPAGVAAEMIKEEMP